ncbi:MAG: hypothetical protein Q4D20_05995 [Clostridia bacterium]|nr:hypothetical protein [Clostridia bacterium]
MKFKIGFSAESEAEKEENKIICETAPEPKRSVVEVYFPDRDRAYAYYNDRFDLKEGDLVYVDGKLEGLLGRVTEVNYNFKINLSYYKRVISLVDTKINGRVFVENSKFVSFDPRSLPSNKVKYWFLPPQNDEDDFVSGYDDFKININEFETAGFSSEVRNSGILCFAQNRVIYLSVENGRGYAIVKGYHTYEVEFEYEEGNIGNLTCSCFCAGKCKHEFAVLLQLRELVEIIEKRYKKEFEKTGFFAAIDKNEMLNLTLCGNDKNSIVFNS